MHWCPLLEGNNKKKEEKRNVPVPAFTRKVGWGGLNVRLLEFHSLRPPADISNWKMVVGVGGGRDGRGCAAEKFRSSF
uniref:Uncharacterized protein n=1 Tax=Anguilla anguilla TaxID=7936 RepID=A0A0E9VGL5_ANGAN